MFMEIPKLTLKASFESYNMKFQPTNIKIEAHLSHLLINESFQT